MCMKTSMFHMWGVHGTMNAEDLGEYEVHSVLSLPSLVHTEKKNGLRQVQELSWVRGFL